MGAAVALGPNGLLVVRAITPSHPFRSILLGAILARFISYEYIVYTSKSQVNDSRPSE
jgi:hypothetical protein